ncbi:glycosyl hydrolase [Bythopirellula polymerisocia]|uniref:Glycosyl hydrolase catalytic core n=1 Tax=Bythopirellula polymerisocia TaxID=2528003 RepID=A0A5C6CEL8_9BACT|nr:glycosyl hydrolase [Bythopirellula polymerisocia]TWU22708.1 Glycosyl hydrolase catalytic core [Bythopirellula polymerisocia]
MINSLTYICSHRLFRGTFLLAASWFLFASLVHSQDTKRGIAGGTIANANALNSRWYYHWSNNPPAEVTNGSFNGQYTPMIWSANTTNIQSRVNNILSYADSLNVEYVLGFNEPERPDQANMSVSNAINVWDIMDDQLAGAGLKLVSPAVSDNLEGREWLADFMSQAASMNLTIDALAFHWYGTVNIANPTASANNFLNRVDSYHNTYGLPVWITEFAGMDFGTDSYTSEELINFNAAFLDIVVPALESRSYVERYSWWQYGQQDNGEQDDTKLINQTGGVWTPTVIGDQYIPSYASGETFDIGGIAYGKDTVYLKGGTVTNSGAAISPAVGSINALQGTSTMSGSADWGAKGGRVVVAAGASLQKIGNNTVHFSGTNVTNEGTFNVTEGTLQVEAAAISGAGNLQLSAGGKLSMGTTPDRSGVSINQSLKLQGGTIEVNTITDGAHFITGNTTLENTTTFTGDGTLYITGPITSPGGGGGGGLIKSGSGTLILQNNSTFQGDTVIQEGTLQIGSGGTFLLQGNFTNSGSLVILGGNSLNEIESLPSIVSTGLNLNFEAAQDLSGDAVWIDSVNAQSLSFAGGNASTTPVNNPLVPGITAAYHIPTTGGASGLGLNSGYFENNGPRSVQDATFEVWFNVENIAGGSDQVLFEAGGTDLGVSFQLNNADLSFNVNGVGAGSTTFSLSKNVGTGWHQAVGIIDLESASDSITLYVDNAFAGTMNGLTIDDWSGGNISGIGSVAGSLGAGGTPIAYHDNLAIVRYYQNKVFDENDVSQNYNAIVSSGVVLPTTMHIDGNFTQESDGTLELDLLSTSMHSYLSLTGSATLSGILNVNEIAGFAPSAGETFTILTADNGINGEFDTVNLPSLSGLQWGVDYSATEVKLSIIFGADFDDSGTVDGRDFLVWQRGFGLSGQLDNTSGDADGNGVVDGNDLKIWQAQYGTSPGTLLSATSTVPEPTSLLITMAILLGHFCKRYRDA